MRTCQKKKRGSNLLNWRSIPAILSYCSRLTAGDKYNLVVEGHDDGVDGTPIQTWWNWGYYFTK